MFAPMKSRSSLKLGHLGSKTRSPGQIVISRPFQDQDVLKFETVTWSQKLGHQAKSKENLVNTLVVTFLKQS